MLPRSCQQVKEDNLPLHWGSNPGTSVYEANALPLTPQQTAKLSISKLSLDNKILIYKVIVKPIWFVVWYVWLKHLESHQINYHQTSSLFEPLPQKHFSHYSLQQKLLSCNRFKYVFHQ